MWDPHLHPVGSCRIGAMKQWLFFFLFCFPCEQQEKIWAPLSDKPPHTVQHLSKLINLLHFFHLGCRESPPHISSSSFPHVLHTSRVLMTPKRKILLPPPHIILSICLSGFLFPFSFFFFFMAGQNCKHTRRNYIRGHPVLNEREETGRR